METLTSIGYASIRKDFEVAYRFFTAQEGGRKTGPPFQMYRSDWLYEGDDVVDGVYMIWPIFLNEAGDFLDFDIQVAVQGTAQMYIVNEELRRNFHASRITPGVKGYFMEGPNRVAEATVTKLLAIDQISVGL
jgi:hypothetical protein